MKKASLLFILLSTFIACEQSNEESIQDGSVQEEKQIIESTIIQIDSIELIPEEISIPNDWEKMQLNGRVKSLKSYGGLLEADGSAFGGDGGWVYTYFFDTLGYIHSMEVKGMIGFYSLTEIEYIYSSDKVLTHRVLSYDEDIYDEDETFWEKEKFFYNESNQLVKVKTAGEDKQLIKETEYKYYDNGKLKSEVEFDKKGNIIHEKHLEYAALFRKIDFKHRIIKNYYSQDSLVIKTIHIENEDESISEVKTDYEFDKFGNWTNSIEQIRYKENNTFSDWEYYYNEVQEIEYFD
jgi:hypothetical protein